MECRASSYMTNVTMRRQYLTIWDAFVDTLLCFRILSPTVDTPPSQWENTTSIKGSSPGLFGRVHMLSKYPKATSVSWALDENEKKAPLEHCLLPKSGVPAEGQILDPNAHGPYSGQISTPDHSQAFHPSLYTIRMKGHRLPLHMWTLHVFIFRRGDLMNPI